MDVYLKPTRKKEIKKRNETHDIDCDIEKTTEAIQDERQWINLGRPPIKGHSGFWNSRICIDILISNQST